MKRFVLICLLSCPLSAAQVVVGMHDGRTTTLDLQDGDSVDLIVQFRDRPLFLRGGSGLHATSTAMLELDDRFAQLARDLGESSRIRRRFERIYSGASVTVPRADVARIAHLDYVASVHTDGTMHAYLSESVTKIGADKVWSTYGIRGKGVTVAVIDTGIDYTHHALGGGFGPGARVIGGYDFVNNDRDPMDDNGHGTHVAGIIGANANGLVGVAPEVNLLAYKVLNADGSGRDSDIIAAIERALDPDENGDPSDHADVINLSLGGGGDAESPVSIAVENAVDAGVIVAVAAGNNGGFYQIGSPAAAPDAITVGATDLNDGVAYFSSGGPAVPLAIKPEVVAPGVNILSLAPGGGTAVMSGTSMACPHIAGVAALLRALHPGWTVAQIKSAIVTTAEALNGDVMSSGGGRVDGMRAAGMDADISPAVLFAGRVVPKQAVWTSISNVHLRNIGNQSRKFNAMQLGAAPGVIVSIDPATVTLNPNESKDVQVTVAVDNSIVPFPREGSLALSGTIVFSGGASLVHMRWAFLKSAHVRLNGDAGSSIYLSSADGGTTVGIGNFDQSARPVDFYMPPGFYDAQAHSIDSTDGFQNLRIVFAPRQRIDEEATYDFDRDTATPTVTRMKRDADGRKLADLAKPPGSWYDAFNVIFPQDSRGIDWIAVILANNRGTDNRLYTTTIPTGFMIGGSEVSFDGASTLRIAQYGPTSDLLALDRDIASSSWVHFPLRIPVSPQMTNPIIQFGAGLLWRDPTFANVFPALQNIKPSGGTWSGDVYMTREANVSPLTSVAMLRVTGDVGKFKGFPAADAHVIRARNDGLALWPYLTDGPATYVAHEGDLLAFGEATPHPEMSISAAGGNFFSNVTWTGALGESLGIESFTGTATLRDANGATVASASPALGLLALPSPGVYTFELTKKFGSASARVTSKVDSTKFDSAPPTFRSMRIVDKTNRLSGAFAAGSAATLTFTAIDVVPGPNGGSTFAYVSGSRTSVAWSPHGASKWSTLQTNVGRMEMANTFDELSLLGHPPAGTLFTTDLSPLTRTRGDIDLRIHIEDATGNSTEYVLAPALTVGEARRRTAGH